MQKLRVEITEFEDDANWRWRLLDQTGAFLADHEVRLNREDGEYGGYRHLPTYLRWNAGVGGGGDQELLRRVGGWIAEHAWGPLAEAILEAAEHGPVVVTIAVPPGADALLFRPFELPFVTSPSAPAEVSLIYDSPAAIDAPRPSKDEVGSALRVLAIFSAPGDQVALNTRFERRELRQLIKKVALTGNRSIELRVLQYGVTRLLLEEVLAEGRGWDMIHFSGHGLPSGLVFEQQDGSTDVIRSTEFASLLRPVRDRLKLVTLSSCESGAVAAANALERLGISRRSPESAEEMEREEADSQSALPGVAQSVADEIGCAVLAMRYPVEDEFAIKLTGGLYQGLLEYGQTVSRSLQMVLQRAVADGGGPALSIATPALFGALAIDLKLEPPPGEPSAFDASATRLPYFDAEPEYFVGRVRPLARASAALAPKSPHRGVVFHGMAGAGKTSCALELAYRHEQNRFEAMAWHRAPTDGQSIRDSLANFAVDLETQLEGLELAHVVGDVERLKRFLPRLRRLLAERSLLIVLDNVESLLTEDGDWRDERWGLLLDALVSHDGLSRLVLTTRVSPRSLRDRPDILFEPIDSLSVEESALLAQQLPNLGRLMATGSEKDRGLVRRTLEIVQGNPKLIELADRQALDAKRLEQRIREADAAWSQQADLSAFFNTGEPDDQIEADDFLRVLEGWTEGIASTLPDDCQLAFKLLCCLEANDRRLGLIKLAWEPLWQQLTSSETVPDFSVLLATLVAEGLVDAEDRDGEILYRIHPAVEQAERKAIDPKISRECDLALSAFWGIIFSEGSKQHETTLASQAGLSAAPYLLRRGEIEELMPILERVVTQDPHPNTIATALPHLQRALELADGPREKRRVRTALVRALLSQSPSEINAEIRELIDLAYEDGDFVGVLVLRGTLFNAFVRTSHLREAKALLEEPLAPEVAAVQGPWSEMADEARRLRVMLELGEDAQALEEAKKLIEKMDETDEESDKESGITTLPWNVRESTLGIARTAARSLGQPELALELNEAVRESEVAREAPLLERAKTDFNDFSPLIVLGRLDEAEALLQHVRAVAEQARELHLLANALDAWATLKGVKGHMEDAVAFSRRSLHVAYAYGEAPVILVCHHNLTSHLLTTSGEPEEIVSHKLAEMLIRFQTETNYPSEVEVFREVLKGVEDRGLPGSFEELCQRLQEHAEVDFRRIFDRLPLRVESGDEALEIVIRDGASGA